MALNYLLSPEFQISVTSGKPDTGGWVETYLAGTRTKYFTASSFDGTKNPFRVPLDSLGQAVILADTGSLYDVYVYNRYGTLLFSRYNVAPQDGGGISSVNITSTDGSIVVTNTGNGVDLSVNGHEPSVLRATATTLLADGPFSFTRRQVSGNQIEVSNGHVLVDTGWYHYDITVRVIWDSVLREEHAPVTLTANTDSATISFDLSRVHDETIQLSGEFRALQDNTEFTVSMSGLPTGIAVGMTDFGMHSIKGLGANGSLGPVYEGIDGVIVDNENDTITCDYDVVQRKLTEGDSISIDENQRISADVGNAVLTIQKNGTTVQTFSANEKTDKTANISVPTKGSDIQNDLGWITSSSLPTVNNAVLTIQKNGSTVETFSANAASDKIANIVVPEYTAGTDVKISQNNVISSLHGLKSYSRTQPTGGYGDMVEDDVVLGIYHISPPTIVSNDKKNNTVYEYKVTDITNVSYFDIGYAMTPDADGFVPNVHFIIDLTGEITDDSDPSMIGSPHDYISLNVGYGNTKAQLANYYARWIPIYIGHKYLVDFTGNVAHVSVLGENRIQDIAPNFGDVQEYISTDPNTTHHDIAYKLERSTAYHMDIYTNALQAENTDKYTYRVGLGVYGAQNNRYLTGWIRQDSGKAIHQHLDFTSDIFTSMYIEFDKDQYPMATQTVNLMIVGTKERF